MLSGYNRVRVVAAATGTFYGVPMKSGDIYTVAGDGRKAFSGDGGPATRAALNRPDAAALDGAGNLVISDQGTLTTFFVSGQILVRAVRTGTFYGLKMIAGHIYTVAGGGRLRLGDGGPATSAAIAPAGVAIGAAGGLLIADNLWNRIRSLAG